MPAILLEHDLSPPPPAQLTGIGSVGHPAAEPSMSPVLVQLLVTGTVCLFLAIAFLSIRWYLHKLIHPTQSLPTIAADKSDASSVLVAFDWYAVPVHLPWWRSHAPHMQHSHKPVYTEHVPLLGGCQGRWQGAVNQGASGRLEDRS